MPLPLGTDKFDRREVECVQRPDRERERLQRTCEHDRQKLDERDPTEQLAYRFPMRASEVARIRTHSSYSRRRLAINECRHRDADGR
jgi:hypothetical protein